MPFNAKQRAVLASVAGNSPSDPNRAELCAILGVTDTEGAS